MNQYKLPYDIIYVFYMGENILVATRVEFFDKSLLIYSFEDQFLISFKILHVSINLELTASMAQ